MILVNVVVSAAVVTAVLLIWNRVQTSRTPQVTTPQPSSGGQAGTVVGLTRTAEVLVQSTPRDATPEVLIYTVHEGDTLSAIAAAYGLTVEDLMVANQLEDPNVLSLGQTLTIPVSAGESSPVGEMVASPTPEPVLPPIQTPTSSGPPLVEIADVMAPGNLEAEVAVIRNRGGVSRVELWKLSDADGNTFTFPAVILYTDAEVRVHSGPGTSSPTDLYWSREVAAWDTGELITLRDAEGNVVDTYIVP
jgi:LysM repeat protein